MYFFYFDNLQFLNKTGLLCLFVELENKLFILYVIIKSFNQIVIMEIFVCELRTKTNTYLQ